MCGETVLGRGNESFGLYKRICPAWLEDERDVHETEPYVYAKTVTGRTSEEPGHAKNSWLTSTASWTFVSISQAILGIQPDYDGLRVTPCLPDELTEYTVRRQLRRTKYVIRVRKTGSPSVTVNGIPASSSLIPLFPEKDRVTVEITQ